MHKLFLFIGRTASGKSTLAKELSELFSLKVVKSYTTRPPRLAEIEGYTDHIHITNEEFDKLLPSAIAYTEINGNRYCTTKEQLLESDIYVIDPLGVTYLREQCIPDLELVTIYINCGNLDVRKARFLQRLGSTVADFESRDISENEQFTDFELNGLCEYDVENSFDTADALSQLINIFIREV